jgi:hypothetical protein
MTDEVEMFEIPIGESAHAVGGHGVTGIVGIDEDGATRGILMTLMCICHNERFDFAFPEEGIMGLVSDIVEELNDDQSGN